MKMALGATEIECFRTLVTRRFGLYFDEDFSPPGDLMDLWSINTSKEAFVVWRAEQRPDCLPEVSGCTAGRESAELGLVDPPADEIEVIGAIGLLPDIEAKIALALACRDGQLTQRCLDPGPIRGSSVQVRDDVEVCTFICFCAGRNSDFAELAIHSQVGWRG
jgi:hypothetical protein